MGEARRARVVYVTGGLPFSPGETFITPEILELRSRGIEVTVVPLSPRGPALHEDARRLIPFTIATGLLSPEVLAGALREGVSHPVRAARALRALLRSRSARILAKNLAVFPKGLWLAGWARRAGVAHIHAHWAGTSATMAFVASDVAGIPWSFTAHRWDIPENNLVEEKSRSATFVRAIDTRGGEELAAHMGPHAHKLRVIHVGVRLPARSAPPPGRSPLQVIMAAAFFEKKGHAYAVEAMKHLDDRGVDVVLDLAGVVPAGGQALYDETRRRVGALDLSSRVRFLGVVPHEELVKGLEGGRWDLALLPSIVTDSGEKEGIPVSLMEAMAAGIPVVAAATGGIPELVGAGSGVLVEPRDAEAIAHAIERLAGDADLRLMMGHAASRQVREGFEVRSIVDRLLAEMRLAPGRDGA